MGWRLLSFLLSTLSLFSFPVLAADNAQEFYLLCKSGTAKQISTAIRGGAKVNSRDDSGDTCLTWAAAFNNSPDAVQTIINAGADATATGKDGLTPMALASLVNRNREIASLIAVAEATQRKKNRNPPAPSQNKVIPDDDSFIRLCEKGTRAEVASALDRGANIRARGKDGETPLIAAVLERQDREVIRLLIERGAEVNASDDDGNTALSYAAIAEDEPITSLLLKNNANPNIANKKSITPLIYATRFNKDINIIVNLIEHGSDIYYTNKIGESAAIVASRYNENEEILSYIISKICKNPPCIISDRDKFGMNIFLSAVDGYNSPEIIRISFMFGGKNINEVDSDGRTALMLAARHDGSRPIVEYLMEGSNPYAYDKFGTTALHYVCMRSTKNEDIFPFLWHGVDINIRTRGGSTPLMIAAGFNKNVNFIGHLLKSGADPSLINAEGKTAYDFAKMNKSIPPENIINMLNYHTRRKH